jgi:hypothetical protein
LASEDVSWCLSAAKAGYMVTIDPSIILKREVVSLL